jgi:hypothetical protein
MRAMLDPATAVRRSPRAAYRKLQDGAGGVLLNLDTAAYHGVNEIGALIWSLLDDGPTISVLIARMRAAVPEAPPQLDDDVAAFVQGLAERELVSLSRAESA